MKIFKVLRAAEWQAFQAAGHTDGAPVDLADGFIHFSTAAQLAETLARHFTGEDGLELVAVDAAALGEALKWEKSRGGADFPHLYAPLALDRVVWHAKLPLQNGRHVLPEELV